MEKTVVDGANPPPGQSGTGGGQEGERSCFSAIAIAGQQKVRQLLLNGRVRSCYFTAIHGREVPPQLDDLLLQEM